VGLLTLLELHDKRYLTMVLILLMYLCLSCKVFCYCLNKKDGIF
jgi:hypothetical protein